MAGKSLLTASGHADEELSALRSLVEGTASTTGEEFFRTLVRHLSSALHANHAFIAEFVPPNSVRTLAFWSGGKIVPNIQFELPDTPCEDVYKGGLCHIPSGVHLRFPRDKGIESYLGVPVTGKDGTVHGHLCVLDEQPMPPEPRKLFVFEMFAARAASELDRLRLEEKLRASEERFRDLFDEAPIAYVHEGLDSRFIRANKTALRILGVRPEEAVGFIGISLAPDTPSAQRRIKEAFESINRGTDTSGVILELRRKEDGRTIFIQWWSRPDPSGTFTRTMFVDITDRILMEQEQARLQAQNVYLQEEIKSVHNFDEIVGASAGLLKVLDNVRRVAPTDATVLIWGETGTGKELIARAIHSASRRADAPFIKINCAALPAGLIESELFGHERGAFSGAIQKRIGRFELANGGTIFLDEVGEIPLDVQVKLLRVLQEREFDRVGSNQPIKTDVRVIAATNRDLLKAIADGKFRSDLYYRLNVFPVTLPALRERKQDIPLLAQFFVQKYGPRVGRRVDAIDAQTIDRLLQYHWPGNIRELENIIERAIILANSPVLVVEADVFGHSPAASPPAPVPPPPVAAPAPAAMPAPENGHGAPTSEAADLNSIQRAHILSTLNKANWVVEGANGAAVQLGMKPATLRHRMKKLGIVRDGAPRS